LVRRIRPRREYVKGPLQGVADSAIVARRRCATAPAIYEEGPIQAWISLVNSVGSCLEIFIGSPILVGVLQPIIGLDAIARRLTERPSRLPKAQA
jgi:hypothetical protein